MSNKDKFKELENPAMMYISKSLEEVPTEKKEPPEQGTQNNGILGKKNKKVETKSKRKNLILYPSVCAAGEKRAKKLGYASFNDYINELIKADCGL